MPYLPWSARTFSCLKHDFPQAPLTMIAYDTPLWHHHAFRSEHKEMYFCPWLIRGGILTVGGLLKDDSLFQQIAPTWQPTYRTAIQQLANLQLPPQAAQLERYLAFPQRFFLGQNGLTRIS